MTAPVKKPQDVWWKRLWRAEPVLITTAVPVLTTIGVLTATQSGAIQTAVLALVQVVGAFGARSQVTPAKTSAAVKVADKGSADVGVILLVAIFIVVLILLFHGRIQ